MQTFRRHIDALSPEARREVMDRARRHEDRTRPAGGPGVSGIHGLGPVSGATRPNDAGDTDGGSGTTGPTGSVRGSDAGADGGD